MAKLSLGMFYEFRAGGLVGMTNSILGGGIVRPLGGYRISITTPRLIIETLTTTNMSAEYIDWLADRDVTQYLECRHTRHSPESVRGYVDNMFASDNDLMMGLFLKSNRQHIGNIKIGTLERLYNRADVGIMIGDQSCWGKGYATEAICGLCDLAFGTIGIRRLWAGAYASNKGSTRAFEKAGFTQEGILRGHCIVNGIDEDAILVGKLSPMDKGLSRANRVG